MPNFHLHWLVAWNALDSIPGPAQLGRDAYLKAGQEFRKKVHVAFDSITKPDQVDSFFSNLQDARRDWEKDLICTPQTRDQVTCFAAFMLGACGPDFWTVSTESGFGVYPDTAGQHFDLGHYNRTHQQFRISIAEIGNRSGVQNDMERSYFIGMATHVAADLVLHQLVNVSAGAYTLLKEDVWNNEHDTVIKDLWKVHNKVEHFWDSYVRYRFLGDLTMEEPVFDDDLKWMDPLGFPLAETLVAKARKKADQATRKALLDRLVRHNPKRHAGKREKVGGEEVRDDVRLLVETPLVFPARASDRILGQWSGQPALLPFVYDRVVHGEQGAYPSKLLYPDAIEEKTSPQMKGGGGLSEHCKLTYFSTKKNTGAINWACLNYLTYRVCPDLGRLRDQNAGLVFGRNAFYDLPAVKQFGERAIQTAARFGSALSGAYNSQDPDALGILARFWNLDTGLGFEVQHVPSWLNQEIVTRFDFVHVFDERIAGGDAGPRCQRADDARKVEYLKGKSAKGDDFSQVKDPAFPVRSRVKFASLSKIEEQDQNAYLDRIELEGTPNSWLKELRAAAPQGGPNDPFFTKAENQTNAWLDAFFTKQQSPRSLRHPFGTAEEAVHRTFEMQFVKHRLTLELRIPIAGIGGETAMFLYCDQDVGVRSSSTAKTHEWASNKRLIAFSKEPVTAGALRVFTARILLDFEKENDRKVKAGAWNNVVPYDKNKKFYGRNFAIATGRRLVLYPSGGGNCFDPTADFQYHANPSPTEHIFLTVFPLVKTPWGVIDAFSKEEVARSDFDEIRKIHMVEWKKVVLCYEFTGESAQFNRCFVDGLNVPVVNSSG